MTEKDNIRLQVSTRKTSLSKKNNYTVLQNSDSTEQCFDELLS